MQKRNETIDIPTLISELDGGELPGKLREAIASVARDVMRAGNNKAKGVVTLKLEINPFAVDCIRILPTVSTKSPSRMTTDSFVYLTAENMLTKHDPSQYRLPNYEEEETTNE